MEQMKVVIINGRKYFIFITLFVTLGTLLTTLLALHFHIYFIIWVGLCVFFGSPFFFATQFRKGFTKNANFIFSDTELSVEISNRKTDEKERVDQIKFNDVESFRAIDSSKDDSSFLKITLKNGLLFRYTILGQKRSMLDVFITDLIFKYINNYNDSLENEIDKIVLIPNLFSTKAGRNLIIGLTILLLISFIIQMIYVPKSIPALMITGISFYLIILAQRKKDIELKKKLR